MNVHSYGVMGVDWEQRVQFERLRDERLARVKQGLAQSELGALLCFDMSNIRYITATHIGTWASDKLNRFCLLPQGDEADHVGLRVGRAPPPALQPVVGRGTVASGHLDNARRDVTGIRTGRERRREDPRRT